MEPTNEPIQQPEQQAINQPAPVVGSNNLPQEKKGNNLIIIVVVILLLVLGLVGTYFFLMNSGNNPFNQPVNEAVSTPTPAPTTTIDDTDPSSIEIDDPATEVQGVESELQGL